MPTTSPEHRNRLIKSPSVSPGRPISVRRESGELETYIDMYGLNSVGDELGRLQDYDSEESDNRNETSTQDFIFSDDVAQELRNLQNLRRLSLDVSNFDPDVPPQNYDISPTLQTQERTEDQDEDNMGNSLYWVPARIHPELAPQEWQSFVQKRDGRLDDGSFASPFHSPMKRGLSRSRSLLSKEVTEHAAEKYTDAGPLLEKRRSTLQHQIKVADLENLAIAPTPETSFPILGPIAEPAISQDVDDVPILVPPPGQILRRAARTGKSKVGSYRRLNRGPSAPPSPTKTRSGTFPDEPSKPRSELDRFQLHDEGPVAPMPSDSEKVVKVEQMLYKSEEPIDLQSVGRKKSRNRAVQIVGTNYLGASTFDEDMSSTAPVSSTPVIETKQDSADQTVPIAETSQSVETPTAESQARPGLKREMSAASLTRAVMNGTVPAATNRSPPMKSSVNEPVAAEAPTGTKKSAWGKLFSSDEKAKKPKDKGSAKLKRTASAEEKAQSERESSNLFSNIFGKKKEKDAQDAGRKASPPAHRRGSSHPPEPHFYNRFPIQLERAIYRMAHLKLSNSRRPLIHQVLLSNFMYGYLALVGANTSGQAHGPSQRSRNPGAKQRQQADSHDRRNGPNRPTQDQNPTNGDKQAPAVGSTTIDEHDIRSRSRPGSEINGKKGHSTNRSRPSQPPRRSSSLETARLQEPINT